MAVRIKDVAELAGVSTATVSRVLNSDNRISDATRQRVLEAVSKSGYRMNNVARSLKTNRSRTIAFLAPELVNDFFMTIAKGVEEALQEAGYSLLVCNADEKIEEESRRIELAAEMCVDGMIIIPSSREGSHFRRLQEMGIPVVLVDRLVEGFSSDAVLVDNFDGAYRAVDYLIQSGQRRFAYIGGDLSLSNFQERYDGFRSALSDRGVPLEEEFVRLGDTHIDSGYRLARELFSSPDCPRQVFIANYYLHVGAVRRLGELDDSLRRGIEISSFDDMTLSSVLGFSGLTVKQPMSRIGREAAGLLMKRIEGDGDGFPRLVRLPTRLVKRDADEV